MEGWTVKFLESIEDMVAVEGLQRMVWSGSETEIVPAHMLIAAVHNGGLLLGAFLDKADGSAEGPANAGQGIESHAQPGEMVGFVFGFPGLYQTPDGPRLKHCSHMLAVHPAHRNGGIGYGLKRAQWQMVRNQGIDLINWTYDPLLSRNAYLNITRLGAVCNQYRRNEYGEMRDDMNLGLPSDRFPVDWWVNTQRVQRRLSRQPRRQLDLAHFLSSGAQIMNPTSTGPDGWPRPYSGAPVGLSDSASQVLSGLSGGEMAESGRQALLLVEIPSNFNRLRLADSGLAMEWRLHTRALFEEYFSQGYLVTDFIYLPGNPARSFYVLSHGEATL